MNQNENIMIDDEIQSLYTEYYDMFGTDFYQEEFKRSGLFDKIKDAVKDGAKSIKGKFEKEEEKDDDPIGDIDYGGWLNRMRRNGVSQTEINAAVKKAEDLSKDINEDKNVTIDDLIDVIKNRDKIYFYKGSDFKKFYDKIYDKACELYNNLRDSYIMYNFADSLNVATGFRQTSVSTPFDITKVTALKNKMTDAEKAYKDYGKKYAGVYEKMLKVTFKDIKKINVNDPDFYKTAVIPGTDPKPTDRYINELMKYFGVNSFGLEGAKTVKELVDAYNKRNNVKDKIKNAAKGAIDTTKNAAKGVGSRVKKEYEDQYNDYQTKKHNKEDERHNAIMNDEADRAASIRKEYNKANDPDYIKRLGQMELDERKALEDERSARVANKEARKNKKFDDKLAEKELSRKKSLNDEEERAADIREKYNAANDKELVNRKGKNEAQRDEDAEVERHNKAEYKHQKSMDRLKRKQQRADLRYEKKMGKLKAKYGKLDEDETTTESFIDDYAEYKGIDVDEVREAIYEFAIDVLESRLSDISELSYSETCAVKAFLEEASIDVLTAIEPCEYSIKYQLDKIINNKYRAKSVNNFINRCETIMEEMQYENDDPNVNMLMESFSPYGIMNDMKDDYEATYYFNDYDLDE